MQKVRVTGRDTRQVGGGLVCLPGCRRWLEVTCLPRAILLAEAKILEPGLWRGCLNTGQKPRRLPGVHYRDRWTKFLIWTSGQGRPSIFFLCSVAAWKMGKTVWRRECWPWHGFVLPRGWLVPRGRVEQTCLMNPQKFPSFDSKLLAYADSAKPPNKFPFNLLFLLPASQQSIMLGSIEIRRWQCFRRWKISSINKYPCQGQSHLTWGDMEQTDLLACLSLHSWEMKHCLWASVGNISAFKVNE